jgi:hypothetical protein
VRFVAGALAALVLAAAAIGGWLVYRGVAVSLQAEENLLATLFTVRLVEQFVAEHGRWPRSWSELERVKVSADPAGSDWPARSAAIQRCVAIDFSADPVEIARQDPMAFTAIRPIGPYYEYRDHGEVAYLQQTIRRSVKGADRP